MQAGLLTPAARATRALFPEEPEPAVVPLTAEEQAQMAVLQKQSARKLQMARVLGAGGFAEETRALLLEALLLQGRIMALEHRQADRGIK